MIISLENPSGRREEVRLISTWKVGDKRPFLIGEREEKHLEYCDLPEVSGRRSVGMLVMPTLDKDKKIVKSSPEMLGSKNLCEICEDTPEDKRFMGPYKSTTIITYDDETQRHFCKFHVPSVEEEEKLPWYQEK